MGHNKNTHKVPMKFFSCFIKVFQIIQIRYNWQMEEGTQLLHAVDSRLSALWIICRTSRTRQVLIKISCRYESVARYICSSNMFYGCFITIFSRLTSHLVITVCLIMLFVFPLVYNEQCCFFVLEVQ